MTEKCFNYQAFATACDVGMRLLYPNWENGTRFQQSEGTIMASKVVDIGWKSTNLQACRQQAFTTVPGPIMPGAKYLHCDIREKWQWRSQSGGWQRNAMESDNFSMACPYLYGFCTKV